MITLNKNLLTQTIVITATEGGAQYGLRMKVFSAFTNKTYYLDLGENLSEFPDRYDEFEILGASIIDWESGVYQYELQDFAFLTNEFDEILTDENGNEIYAQGDTLEVGLLKV